MATLLDRPLWPDCHRALEGRFFALLDHFAEALPRALDFWRGGGYQQLVLDFGVGNFGSVGCRRIYSRLGISWPSDEFLLRAREHLPRIGRMMGEAYTSDGVDFVRQHVLTYAEYDFTVPSLPAPLRGAGLHANGCAYASRWLTAVRPPFCPNADRATCSEFRMLAGMCDFLAHADPQGAASADGRAQFTGLLQALVSGPCCVSCVGAFAQFRLLFQSIDVQVAAGKMPAVLERPAHV
mmetsp:Transcript_21889/g.49879  ORF Transcript_21889/g.49879 Transcript_21889/m.49879 type:complete len:238 (-) Transcript_21889:21-734(-)